MNSLITYLFLGENNRGMEGSKLIKRALESAKKRDVKGVHVTTRENNQEVMIFYQKHGFSKAGMLFELSPC